MSLVMFISLFLIFGMRSLKKQMAAKKLKEQRRQWFEHQHVHVGEPPSRPDWKMQAAKVGGKILLSALIGQYHKNHRFHDHHKS